MTTESTRLCVHCRSPMLPGASVCAACARSQPHGGPSAFAVIVAVILVATGLYYVMDLLGGGGKPSAAAIAADAKGSLIAEAEVRLRQAAHNPDSVTFRNSRVGTRQIGSHNVVCGEMNGENEFGGMTGYTRFAVVDGKLPMIDSRADYRAGFDMLWRDGGC